MDKYLPADGHWLGSVVPKRHAKRSVTRSLLKRQIRAAVTRQQAAGTLPPGLWLVRLKAPFAAAQFPSAASDALRRVAREELDALLATEVARRSRSPAPPAGTPQPVSPR